MLDTTVSSCLFFKCASVAVVRISSCSSLFSLLLNVYLNCAKHSLNTKDEVHTINNKT